MTGFDDPVNAMRLRDYLKALVTDVVDKIRPLPRAGVVLSIYRSGPLFPTSDPTSTDPTLPPPLSPGNPSQVYYADVRLDTGTTVQARLHENIPVAREADYYESENPSGSRPYLIENDQYWYSTTETRQDTEGTSYTVTVPDYTVTVNGFPFVPPRVVVEGSAGKYVVTRIIRGLVRFETPVLDNAYLVGTNRAGSVPSLTDSTKLQYHVYSGERVFNKQGWVGETGWYAGNGFEIELSYGGRWQKYLIHPNQIASTDQNTWRIVPPVREFYSNQKNSTPGDQVSNVLFAYLSEGVVHFYVASKSLLGYFTAADLYLNGAVVVRSLAGTLSSVSGDMPAIDITSAPPTAVWGFSQTAVVDLDLTHWGRPSGLTVLQADIQHRRVSFSGGVLFVASTDTQERSRFRWAGRIRLMSARTIYNGSGFTDIDMPPAGTGVKLVGASPTDLAPISSRLTTSDGFDLTGWCSLFYVPPIGTSSSTSLPENFVVVQTTGYFDIPGHWILIATHNADGTGPEYTLGNGREVDAWKALGAGGSDLTPRTDYPPSWKKEDGVVYLKGAYINNTAGTVASTITVSSVLPEGARPLEQHRRLTLYETPDGIQVAARFDVSVVGSLLMRRSMLSGETVYLNGVSFSAEA